MSGGTKVHVRCKYKSGEMDPAISLTQWCSQGSPQLLSLFGLLYFFYKMVCNRLASDSHSLVERQSCSSRIDRNVYA